MFCWNVKIMKEIIYGRKINIFYNGKIGFVEILIGKKKIWRKLG